jgi:hypothetical protein
MEEESKAVQEVARTTGKAIDAAREAGGFIARFIAGSLEQGMGIFEDRLRYLRWERQLRLMQRADQMLKELGLAAPTRAVPLRLAIPLIQGASLEEDDELQDRWATLLVNAANAACGMEIRRAHIEILEQITVLEAKILDAVYSLPFEGAQHEGIVTIDLPTSARIVVQDETKFVEPPEDIVLAIGNLARIGCLRPTLTMGGGEIFGRVNPTMLGRSFVQACRLPKT